MIKLSCLTCSKEIVCRENIEEALKRAIENDAIIEKSFQRGFNIFCSQKCQSLYLINLMIEYSQKNGDIENSINPKPEII